MVTRAERHFGVDDYIILRPGDVSVKRTVHHYLAADLYRLKIILLPLAVPVASLDHLRRSRHRAVKRKVVEHRFEPVAGE